MAINLRPPHLTLPNCAREEGRETERGCGRRKLRGLMKGSLGIHICSMREHARRS